VFPEWTAIVDRNGDGSASFWIGDANARAERQRPMRRGQSVAVRRIKSA
jgi:hypothetical protein